MRHIFLADNGLADSQTVLIFKPIALQGIQRRISDRMLKIECRTSNSGPPSSSSSLPLPLSTSCISSSLFGLDAATLSLPGDDLAFFRRLVLSSSEDISSEDASALRFFCAFLLLFEDVRFFAVMVLGFVLRVVETVFFEEDGMMDGRMGGD